MAGSFPPLAPSDTPNNCCKRAILYLQPPLVFQRARTSRLHRLFMLIAPSLGGDTAQISAPSFLQAITLPISVELVVD